MGETYTVALALEDFLPTIFSSVGLWFIHQMIGGIDEKLGRVSLIAWLFITIGGLTKGIWKLLMAVSDTQINLVVFDKGLFVWLGTGFLLMVYAYSYSRRVVENRNPRTHVWRMPIISCGFFFAIALANGFPNPTINRWRFIFLGVLTVSNIMLLVFLIQHARRQNLPLVAWLFAFNLIISLLLSGLARIPDQTIPLQWTEQLLNTAAQGAFCYGALKLSAEQMPALQLKV